LKAAFVSADFHRTLGVRPMLGPGLTPGDEGRIGPAMVLSERLWRARFGADPAVIGRSVTVDGVLRTITGVMPSSFDFPDRAEAWLPLNASPFAGPGFSFPVVARLRDDVTLAEASQQVLALGAALGEPASIGVAPLIDIVVGQSRGPLLTFMAATGVVLLVSMTNVANLLLMRAARRSREIGLRRALGAGMWRVTRQLLTESVLLALAGGALGVLVAWTSKEVLLAAAPPGTIPRGQEVAIDLSAAIFTFALSAFVGIGAGLFPAFWSSRHSMRTWLSDGSRAPGARTKGARALLVVVQVGLAVALLNLAGLLVRSFVEIRSSDLGFVADQTLVHAVDLPGHAYREPEQMLALHRQVLQGLAEIPGVVAAGAANLEPFGPLAVETRIRAADRVPGPSGYDASAGLSVVSADYFRAMGIPIIRGRPFTERDAAPAAAVVIINRLLADQLWPGADPIGRRVARARNPRSDQWSTVVGVVANVVRQEISEPRAPMIYLPLSLGIEGLAAFGDGLDHMQYVVRATGEQRAIVEGMRAVFRASDPNLPTGSVTTLDDLVTSSEGERQFEAQLLAASAAAALALAMIGVYGVSAHTVNDRTREIAVRMALGARSPKVTAMVLRQTLMLVLPGLVVGSLASLMATRAIEGSLYGVAAADPLTYACVALLLGAVAMAAVLVPLRRATGIDPADVLRA
jgi:putative ABC transport system permease protein